jgi:hypothetical protein
VVQNGMESLERNFGLTPKWQWYIDGAPGHIVSASIHSSPIQFS